MHEGEVVFVTNNQWDGPFGLCISHPPSNALPKRNMAALEVGYQHHKRSVHSILVGESHAITWYSTSVALRIRGISMNVMLKT
jgi:hypothetical protein